MAADSIEPKTLLRKRLLHDIAELQNRPYSGITLHIQDEDALQQACLILSPEDKPKIHLTVAFGSQYSLSPPTITIQSRVIHPNVFGDYICASNLNTREGYTSAYTLKAICIQILSFFSSETLEQEHGDGIIDLAEYRKLAGARGSNGGQVNYRCTKCGFGDEEDREATANTERQMDVDGQHDLTAQRAVPAGTGLVAVPTEVLYIICEHLDDEEIVMAARAWSGFASIIRKVIRTRELQCFTLKEGAKGTTLGIGVHVERKTHQSEFELVSQLAFYSLGVRRSVHGLPFEHWLPLPLFENNWPRVKKTIDDRLRNTGRYAAINGPPVTGIYGFMNEIAVRLSQEASNLNQAQSSMYAVSERAIESYFHLFHLLLCLAVEDPNVGRDANNKIKGFLDGKTDKSYVTNLGHLLIMVLISENDATEPLVKAIVKEAVTRNVVWMLDYRGASMPELSFMETDAISDFRLQKTFEASKTSYRLLMIAYLMKGTVSRMMTAANGQRKSLQVLCKELFDRHGEPPSGAAVHLAESVKRIQNVKTFPEFLTNMGVQQLPSASEFTTFLRRTVYDSVDKGYSK